MSVCASTGALNLTTSRPSDEALARQRTFCVPKPWRSIVYR
jgi:hypothetical protein